MRRITNWIVFSLYLVTGHWSLLLQPLQDVNHTNTYLISFVLISLLYFKKQKLSITTINLPPLLKVRDNLKTEGGWNYLSVSSPLSYIYQLCLSVWPDLVCPAESYNLQTRQNTYTCKDSIF